MQLVIGIILGVLAWWMFTCRRKPSDKPPTPHRLSKEGRQLQHEIQNFLSYAGEQQEEFHE